MFLYYRNLTNVPLDISGIIPFLRSRIYKKVKLEQFGPMFWVSNKITKDFDLDLLTTVNARLNTKCIFFRKRLYMI